MGNLFFQAGRRKRILGRFNREMITWKSRRQPCFQRFSWVVRYLDGDWTLVRAQIASTSEIRWCQDISGEPGGNEREIICESIYPKRPEKERSPGKTWSSLFPRTLVQWLSAASAASAASVRIWQNVISILGEIVYTRGLSPTNSTDFLDPSTLTFVSINIYILQWKDDKSLIRAGILFVPSTQGRTIRS